MLDPQDPATFDRSRLDWSELDGGRHAHVLAGYRRLAALRRAHPELTDPSFGRAIVDEETRRLSLERGALTVHVNLGEADWVLDDGEVLFSTTGTVSADALVVPPGNGVLVRRS